MKVPWLVCFENQGTLPKQTTSHPSKREKSRGKRSWKSAFSSLRRFRWRKPRKSSKVVQEIRRNDPGNGLISQRSTLSSSCSSSGPSGAESRGIGIETQQEARDAAVRNNESSNNIHTAIVTKPVSADNEKDVIADIEMGGNSRSHKRRSRASRKKTKNSNIVSTDAPTCEAMVEVSTPLNSDVTEYGNDAENSCGDSVASSDKTTGNVTETQNIAENKVLESIQTNYRVESPEPISKKSNTNKKQNGGTVVKSKSLDDDDLVKITELSEASEGEDKSLAECSAVVSEADSDVEWEITEEFKSEKESEERGECLSTFTLPLEELEEVQVTLISPEDERNLRSFLEGLNLVTSPDESVKELQKKESYKERKARTRAAIAEHFMPVLQFPRYLDVIREENSDNNNGDKEPMKSSTATNLRSFIKSQEFVRNKEPNIQKRMESHFPKTESEKVIVVGGKLTETANVEGTWSTSVAETSSSAAEVVYLEDSSTSKTPSDSSDVEENIDVDGDDEDSRSDDISHYSSLQELNTDTLEKIIKTNSDSECCTIPTTDIKILPPSSQLTPPPTPDLATPKNETICEKQYDIEINDFLKNVTLYLTKNNYSAIRTVTKDERFKDLPEETKNKINEILVEMNSTSLAEEDAFSKEFKGFCDELNLQHPCKYVNAVSPPAPSRSPSVSSEGSSKTNSQCTVRYNPMCSSIGDVADLLKDEEIAKENLKTFQPESLRELCLTELMSLPFGADVLEELAEVSQSIQELTGTWQSKLSPSLERLRKHFPTSSIPEITTKKPSKDDTNNSFKLPVPKEEMPFISATKWVGIPTQQDPKVLVCLSPTQKSYLETTKKVPDEAGKLLELHNKFMNRRGYHEEIHDEPDRFRDVETTRLSGNKINENAPQLTEFSNRLLAIIRETNDTQPNLHLNVNDDTHHRKDYYSYSSHVDDEYKTLPQEHKMYFEENKFETKNSPAQDLNEWLKLTREKSTSAPHLEEAHEFSNTPATATTGTYQSKTVNEGTRVRCSGGNTTRSTNILNRRFSLPQEVYQRHIQYIHEKEKELQEEIEKLEQEKRKVIFEMAAEIPVRQFEAEKYHISKKGDIAIHNDEEKSRETDTDNQRVTVMAPTEFFRQKMYDEYMKKVAAREDRKMHKVIKITSSKTSQVEESTETSKCEITHVSGIEDEFMDRVKERMKKFGLKRDDSQDTRTVDSSAKTEEHSQEPVLVMDGELLKDAKELPRHLQEFVDLTRQAADNSEDDTSEGVWSPGQKPSQERPKRQESQEHKKNDEPIPPVWTPKSAGSSPIAERKEFRPVNFESPVLGRKNKPKTEGSGTPDSSAAQPSWQPPESSSDLGVALASSLERRLPTSHSAPASGFSEFSTPRLPRAQNPTITLLQKAREGQLPRGASYIQSESNYSFRNQDDRPPLLGPGDVLYQIKNEYTSESDSERPRKMADLGSRKYEMGIGPMTKDGMPLVLRSEVKEGNQSRWYKKMYDTIHKQKPDRDYVTVRYKQRRARYPYMSGYFSEPEHNAFAADYYDSDGTVSDSKYATLDRRRIQQSIRDKENEYMSSTLPKEESFVNSDTAIRHRQDVYKNQPGRIENYVPGRSSISEKEAKEWWDEVMDIFDGWLDDHSALPSYNYLLSRAITRSHLEQQKNVPQPRGYLSQALKESGYESDSTLVFRRREDAMQQLSPSEHREAYKSIQKGGDVPLHGLRKPAPERPKEETEIEYFPISPTLTRIRIHKNIKSPNSVLCYPLSVPPHPRHVFSEYKRSAPSASVSSIPKPPPIPPSPPKRRSSRNSNTLRLISTMKVRTERSPSSKRHETCFTSTSNVDKHKVKYLKDKITCKLSPTLKRKGEFETKPKLKVTKTLSISPSSKSTITSTLSTSRTSTSRTNNKTEAFSLREPCCPSRSLSASPVRKLCKTCSANVIKRPTTTSRAKPSTFGSEKRKVDLVLPKIPVDRNNKLSKSTNLISPTEVKKAVISQINSLPGGTTYKKSQALYSSVKNGLNPAKGKSLPIQVNYSQRGKELLRPSQISTSLPATPVLSRVNRSRTVTPSPSPSEKSHKSPSTSLDSLKSLRSIRKESTPILKSSSLTSLKSNKSSKQKSRDVAASDKKLKKSKKDQLNGEIAKREKKNKTRVSEKSIKKCAGKAAGNEIAKQLRSMEEESESSENIYALTQDAIQKQREAIQTNSFFQHLFWRDIPSPPPSLISQNSWITEKTRFLQRNPSSFSEPTIGALKIYLNHTKPVTDSKFKSLDAALIRSRSASPKSVTWKMDRPGTKDEKIRSISLPPKLIFTETSRPVSPVLVRKHASKEHLNIIKPNYRYVSPPKLIFTETSRPVSPLIDYKKHPSDVSSSQEYIYTKARSASPLKMIFTETSRPVSPVIERRVVRREESPVERSYSPSKLVLSEFRRPESPAALRKYVDTNHECGIRKSASTSKLIFSETSRPISPIIGSKRISRKDLQYSSTIDREKSSSPTTKLFFSETSRPVSPILERRVMKKELKSSDRNRYSSSSMKGGSLETTHAISPLVGRRHLQREASRVVSPIPGHFKSKSQHTLDSEITVGPSSKLFFTETSRPISPVIERRYINQSLELPRSSSPTSKLYFSETSRPVSPIIERKHIRDIGEERERSSSPVSKLFFTETSRPVSPIVQKKLIRAPTPPSPTMSSPSSRKILHVKGSRAIEDIKKRLTRSHSADETEEKIFDDDMQSITSSDFPQKEYKTYFTEILHSPRRCSRFKEINKFYSTLERMGELERTTSSSELRPRRRYEEEIIDYDRWKEVHTRERAEKELETLYIKLKDDQREKGFLFRPKDIESYRWKRELDRGLRIKDKSVENIKDDFEKLKESSYKRHEMPDELVFRKELYKPLWRGNSVANLASSIVERRSQSEGRVTSMRKKLLESERLLTHGIGSRIWSSLSSEQINLLKGQLAEIYNQNGHRKYQVPPADYSIDVSSESHKSYRPKLSIRRNSDEIIRRRHVSEPSKSSDVMSTSLVLSENEKKRLSQSLSREVMDRVSQRQKHRASLSLVLGKETRGAIAAAEAKIKPTVSEMASPRTCYSLEMSEDEKDRKHKDSDFVLVLAKDDTDAHKNNINETMQEWAQPKKALVSTDVTNRVTSMSETESGSTDESTKTVVYLGGKDVQKKVEYFEQVAEERPYTPTIYRAADNHNNDEEPVTNTQQEWETDHSEELHQPPRKLVSSQSYQSFKELFGEQEQSKVSTVLNAARPPLPNSGSSDTSTPKAVSSESVTPNHNFTIMRTGDVLFLKNKFEHFSDYNKATPFSPRRSRSDPELNRKHQIIIPGQFSGEVDSLRRKYEYPWIYNRGRSRIRRGGVISPIYFDAEDRYMPHINIISKIASLYPKKTVFLSDVRQKSTEELAKILGCPLGEVERIRQRFDSSERNISLLGHMFTSSPNMHELRDIAPYLTGPWVAHKYPKMEDNTRSLSSPENTPSSWDTSYIRKDRPRPKSASPPRLKTKLSPILKNRPRVVISNGNVKQNYDPKIHQPVGRYQPPCPKFAPVRYKSSWPQTTRPSVTFKGVVF